MSRDSRERLLNRDGSFNVIRCGLARLDSSTYHSLLEMSWPRFHSFLFFSYLLINIVFAAVYMALGGDSIAGPATPTFVDRFFEAFFFSVQSFTTVGYGHLSPTDPTSSMVAAVEAFVGLLSFAFGTGLLFARFSRPTAKIGYSKQAVIAPFQGSQAFMIRIMNVRRNTLIEVGAQLLYTQMEGPPGQATRRFYPMRLERARVTFFPLQWTIVHPIDSDSPIWELTENDLREREAEVLVLVTALDETFSQTVHSRTSYRFDEVAWQARFNDMYVDVGGHLGADFQKLSDIRPVPVASQSR